MAGYSLLERTPVEEWSHSVAEAEKEHDSRISENYQRLIRGDVKQSASVVAPVKTEAPATDRIPNAAQRLQDYVPITVGMKKLQRIGDMPTYSSSKVTDYAPVKPQATTVTRKPLFEGLVYRDGELINMNAPAMEATLAPAPVETPVYAPSFTPEVAPAFVPAPAHEEVSEDALPTRKTMESLNRAEQKAEERVGFFAALSTKTKVVLAAVVAAVVLMFAIVCVNTVIINSLNAGISAREAEIMQLEQEANDIQSAISDITDSDAIAQWAQNQGMELGLNG